MTMTRRTKTRSKRPLSAAKLQQREAVFALYRDTGPGRTYERLIEAVRPKYGPISKRSLVNWSHQHNWRALIAEHDKRLNALPPSLDELGPDFNMVEALERIACMALQRALASHVEVRTPQDFSLVAKGGFPPDLGDLLSRENVGLGPIPAVRSASREGRKQRATVRSGQAGRPAAQGGIQTLADVRPSSRVAPISVILSAACSCRAVRALRL
jgi:hypothetical protein